MQQILFDEKLEIIEKFSFRVNGGGKLMIQGTGITRIEIVFKDGKFDDCDFRPQTAMEKRSYWHIVGAINDKIAEIEAREK